MKFRYRLPVNNNPYLKQFKKNEDEKNEDHSCCFPDDTRRGKLPAERPEGPKGIREGFTHEVKIRYRFSGPYENAEVPDE